MNKLIILLGVSILCAAGCVPTYQTSVVTPVPATAIVVPPPPKAGVIDMPDQHVQHVSVKKFSTIDVYSGSLKENIERIAKHYGWRQVVWDAPEDYRWVGKARIHGENLQDILRQLLTDYPLQAVFYKGNHVLYIHTRTLK